MQIYLRGNHIILLYSQIPSLQCKLNIKHCDSVFPEELKNTGIIARLWINVNDRI